MRLHAPWYNTKTVDQSGGRGEDKKAMDLLYVVNVDIHMYFTNAFSVSNSYIINVI